MGLLDEAIREHLDLKRRRGADPAEVERAEREALGPVRRGPESQVPVVELYEEVHAESGYEPSEDGSWDELVAKHEHEHAPATELAAPDEFEPDFGPNFQDHEHAAGHEPQIELIQPAQPVAETASAPPAPAPADDEPATAQFLAQMPAPAESHPANPPLVAEPHGETVEYDVERAMAAEDHDTADGLAPDERVEPPAQHAPVDERDQPASEEDVLQETPEFLQDTPDHDRLWFEQRPPRDFDFDG